MDKNAGCSLGEDEWRIILSKLSISGLARAACVCRSWREFAEDSSTLVAAIAAPYKLRAVIGKPSHTRFWKCFGLSCFAISHKVQRSDTVVALAIRYQAQAREIRRLNNMMSDLGIYARDRILIPVTSPEMLEGQTCYIETDFFSRRELAIIYPDGSPRPEHGVDTVHNPTRFDKQRLKSSVFQAMKRSLKLDEETAHYYLSLTHGNLKAAMSELRQDLEWEAEGSSSGR